MDVRIYIVLIVFTQWKFSNSLTISGEISNNMTFIHKIVYSSTFNAGDNRGKCVLPSTFVLLQKSQKVLPVLPSIRDFIPQRIILTSGASAHISGGSKGVHPPTDQNFLNFMQFLGKSG